VKSIDQLLSRFDPVTGEVAGAPMTRRHLGDLRGSFFDAASYEAALRAGNPVLYTVASVEPGHGDGDLHYALARIMPGRIGPEYYMTKGHFHAWRAAAEIYIALTGEGMMLLEDESSSTSYALPLSVNEPVYVPGHTAHRTINVGSVPLAYLGVYPAKAGHDYGAIAQRNFSKVVIERHGKPVLVDRVELTPGNIQRQKDR
jgi:glucose-6-phosphate isomerase